jgi:hypothetical protein
VPAEERSASGLVKIGIWLVVSIVLIGVSSYVFYRIDSPPQADPAVSQSLFREISSNFSYGFSQSDLSKIITLREDQAMSITWRREPGGLQANFILGPYTVKDRTTKARLVAMVPPSAKLTECAYSDTGRAIDEGGGYRYAPAIKGHCHLLGSQSAQYFSTALVPNNDPNGFFYIFLSFKWSNPTIVSLGIGKYAVHLRYQGRFSTDPAAHFFPADRTKILYDTSGSGSPTGLPHGVMLQYRGETSETITDSAPAPASTIDNTQIWVADAGQPTYFISITAEDSSIRTILQLVEQGAFLVIGGAIGATFPRLRRRKNADD